MPKEDKAAAPHSRGVAFVSEEAAMDRAVRLGARSWVSARPNPPVGCVVLDENGQAVGEGRHIRPGEPHAEVVALNQAGSRAPKSTLVVTLEPCNHHGRTPPCSERILKSGVRRVVYATKDSNPTAEGGATFLRHHGVDVQHTPHEGADRLNAPHLTWCGKGRPHVIAKWAQTQEGHMCPPPNHDRWITGIASRREVHRLRGRVDAILTGLGTVRADDCRLDPRLYPRRQTPLVAVASRNESIPRDTNIRKNAKLTRLTSPTPEEQLSSLAQLGVQVVLLEAGPTLLHAYWQAGLVDEAWVFVGPVGMPNGSGKSPIPDPKERLRLHAQGSATSFGPDHLYRLPIESN
ncbi:MAG: bifunctional diaminohydroxyphosphoribosylaminopyrimidine deaminase/5-amino-6-(5-phosphoribosylamino)uracil reductase RibD [Phycisphaera sp. TMED24]|nr:MAG: bifunctional diaminohydroxyphosphoribosylaminopyrimidine deaminase/5-amino-6-(5-phosphoribosylamino)uracil reductase RibD [Phycisphaera sp. TMED24]